MKKRIEIIVEKQDGILWGRVESDGWMPTPYGETETELVQNLKDLIADYVLHEGENDCDWNSIDWNNVELNIK